MSKHKLRTPEQVREDFANKGISIAEWARQHGYSSNLVFEVLSGRKKCIRGQSHQIAVRLGIKHGEIATAKDIGLRKLAA